MDRSPIFRTAAALAVIAFLLTTAGCEVDSFFDPSRTGRFEFEPTTIPVLERIDVIEPQQDFWATATPPTPEDLMPRELEYLIYPGDVLTISVYELQQPGMWTSRTGRVDATGNYRIPEIGDVRAAGLTAQQFENEIRTILQRIILQPQVDVVVEQGGGLRYTVYGFVANSGQFNLDNPNLRLIEALASAGGVPLTTERVYIIRQVILSPEYQPRFQRPEEMPPLDPSPRRPPPQDRTLEDLIEQLENPPPRRERSPDVRPGMLQEAPTPPMVDIDELEPVRTPRQPPVDVEAVTPAVPGENGPEYIYDPQRGEWVRTPARRATPSPPPPPGMPAPVAWPQAVARIIEVNYERLSRGDTSQNVVIRPGDMIYVEGPRQGFIYIDGEVARVGVYNMPGAGTLTLSRAITSAGGLGPIAVPWRVDLTRKVGHNREATIRLDLAAIRQRTEPDIIIKPDDFIMVGTTWWATPLAIVRNGFRVTYGFGFLLDRNFGSDVFGVPPESRFR